MPNVTAIQVAPSKGERESVDSVVAISAHGLEGDYHAGKDDPQQVTLITKEAIESFNRETLNAFKDTDLGRNIVTSGVDLAGYIGKNFQIGEVTLEGLEHCQPCATLGARLAHYRLTASEVVKGFKDLGGIRARVVEGGVIRTGDTLTLV